MPKWNARNLTQHHKKRLADNPGCFEDLLGIAGKPMTESQYERRTNKAFDRAWGEYEGESWNPHDGGFRRLRAYYVDDDLVVAVTDISRDDFITCFHEHFNRSHGADPRPEVTVGQRRLRYQDQLKMEEKGKMIRNLKRIRGV